MYICATVALLPSHLICADKFSYYKRVGFDVYVLLQSYATSRTCFIQYIHSRNNGVLPGMIVKHSPLSLLQLISTGAAHGSLYKFTVCLYALHAT